MIFCKEDDEKKFIKIWSNRIKRNKKKMLNNTTDEYIKRKIKSDKLYIKDKCFLFKNNRDGKTGYSKEES